MKKFMALGLGLVLSGCGADVESACEAYIDAYTTCTTEAFADDQDSIDTYVAALDGYCSVYEGLKDQESADYLTCLADAYDSGDCSTVDGYTAIASELSNCTY